MYSKQGEAIATFLQISSGVMFLGNVLNYLQFLNEARGAASKIFRIIERKPDLDVTDTGNGVKPLHRGGAIHFDNVSFAYPSRPDQMILKGLTLTINDGERVAIVGPSGGGKSTVLAMILRLYDTTGNTIFILIFLFNLLKTET